MRFSASEIFRYCAHFSETSSFPLAYHHIGFLTFQLLLLLHSCEEVSILVETTIRSVSENLIILYSTCFDDRFVLLCMASHSLIIFKTAFIIKIECVICVFTFPICGDVFRTRYRKVFLHFFYYQFLEW